MRDQLWCASTRWGLGTIPSFAKANGIDIGKIKVEPLGFPTRELCWLRAKLIRYRFLFLVISQFNSAWGAGERYYNDFTGRLWAATHGNAVIVNTDFAKDNPEIVKKFVVAIGAGWKDAINNPKAGIGALVKRNPAADSALEERRLELAIKANVLSDYVKANGMGGIEKSRFDAAIQQLAETYEYKNKPDAKLYYTDAYLPAGGVKLN